MTAGSEFLLSLEQTATIFAPPDCDQLHLTVSPGLSLRGWRIFSSADGFLSVAATSATGARKPVLEGLLFPGSAIPASPLTRIVKLPPVLGHLKRHFNFIV